MKKYTMKTKVAGLAGSLMLSAALLSGFGAAAEDRPPEPPVTQSEASASEAEPGARRAKMQEFRETVKEKWNGLTDEQKQEIYALAEARMNADIQLLQKFADNGVLDADKVSARIERMRERMQQLREADLCPLPIGRPGHMHENPDSHS